MFTTTVRLEVEKKIKERTAESSDAARLPEMHFAERSSPAPDYEKSDHYRLVDPLFRLDEIERLVKSQRV